MVMSPMPLSRSSIAEREKNGDRYCDGNFQNRLALVVRSCH